MFEALAKAFRASKRVALTTHVAPDGDGLGSALALKYGLEKIGVASDIVVNGPVGKIYAFMDPESAVRSYPQQVDRAWLQRFDAVAVLDCSNWGRIGALTTAFPQSVTKICIDHHEPNAPFADVSYARTSATATGELVHEFICEHLGQPLDARMALPIYVSLYTDSGGFRFSNTTAKAMRLAASCVELGVQPAKVNIALNESRSLTSLRLAARALAKLEIDASGKLAWLTLGLDDFRETGATVEDIAGLIDYPRSIEGVEVAFFAFEDEPRSTKVSFRSKEVADMNALAKQFGGGGHQRAAGALIREELATAQKKLIAAARETVRSLK